MAMSGCGIGNSADSTIEVCVEVLRILQLDFSSHSQRQDPIRAVPQASPLASLITVRWLLRQ